jgi:PAS domain S-box-containing protein
MDHYSRSTAAGMFPGDSIMHAAVHALDWSTTALGPVADWPAALRTATSLCLDSQFQIAIAWGPDLVYLYNDAAIPIFGAKHPWALGRPVAEVWPEAWDTVGPMLQSVLASGKATRGDDLLLLLERKGFVEECYFTFSYSPIRDAGARAGGVFITVMETSEQVLAARRQRTLAELASAVALAGDDNPLPAVRAALERNPDDLPLAMLWLDGADAGTEPALCSGAEGMPALMLDALRACAAGSLAARTAQVMPAAGLPGAQQWPGGAAPGAFLCVPLWRAGPLARPGVLLLAVNPRQPLDANHRAFLDSVAGYVGHAVTVLEARAAERRRVEAMAELDRAKTQFFADASHELRTPLTLVLGPLTALAEQAGTLVAPAWHEDLSMALRNAQRLQRLVNSLMDFARIEAGRLQPEPEALDPAALTTEIAGLFRSACEAAGLELAVDCGAAHGQALLDREMWEKIVSNLLSNACKFTEAGRICLRLARHGDALVLTVADTGPGIAPEELDRVFERFYRSARTVGRSAEGSGVGLALVQELARLHGGDVSASGSPGAGACFTVTVPWRAAPAAAGPASEHGRRTRLAGLANQVRLQRLPALEVRAAAPGAMRVVVVDDNADVARYIERVLGESCDVTVAHDVDSGMTALRAAVPDLVLVDVMMPGVNGLELVRRVRDDAALRTVPVLVLSARAGEEARLDALEAGADDYLAKPFSARELVARVRSHVQMARVRRAAAQQEVELRREIDAVRHDLASVLDGTNDAFISVDRELRVLALNAAAVPAGRQPGELVGQPLARYVTQLEGSTLEAALRLAAGGGHPQLVEHQLCPDGRWFSVRCYPAPHGVILFATDITGRKQAEQALLQAHAELERRVEQRTAALRDAHQLLAAVFDRAPGGIAITDLDGTVVRVNAAYAELTGYAAAELPFRPAAERVDAADLFHLRAQQARLVAGQCEAIEVEMRYRRPDGRRLWVSNFVSMIVDGTDQRFFLAIARDITERKRVELERQAAQQELRTLYERLQTVRESERTALAREVHDQLGQILSAAKIDIKLLEGDLQSGTAPLERGRIVAELGSACATLERGIGLVREIATELRAPELDEQGLYAAIAWHARDFERRTRIACHVTFAARRVHPSRAAAAALLGIFLEAMTNVLRHAQASQVWISIARRGPALLLRVRDDGIGIGRGRVRAGATLGLTGMRERAELVDGKLLAGPLAPQGTLVSVRVPLKQRKDKH